MGALTPAPDRTLNPEVTEEVVAGEKPLDTSSEQALEEDELECLDVLLIELQRKINDSDEFKLYKNQIVMDVSRDGLRIRIADIASRPMFDLGSARLQPYFEDVLYFMADTVRAVSKKISVSGHTDAKPYSDNSSFGNWELSASRTNVARRVLRAGGLGKDKVARIAGYASSVLFNRDDPYSPSNRRIDILVPTKRALQLIEGQPDTVANPEQAAELIDTKASSNTGKLMREKLNVFEDGVLQFDDVGN